MSLRADGRQQRELRPLFLVANCLTNCVSSACAEVGGSRVVACLRGPQQLTTEARGHRGKVICSVNKSTYAEARRENAHFHRTLQLKELDVVLEGIAEQIVCLETLPQLQLELTFDITTHDAAGELTALVATMVVCLANAGVAMKELACAGSAALMSDGTLCLDPSVDEHAGAVAVCNVVVLGRTGEVCFANTSGNVDAAVALDLLDTAASAAEARRQETAHTLTS